jgi:ribA/ribD-fused uncharacterized protein
MDSSTVKRKRVNIVSSSKRLKVEIPPHVWFYKPKEPLFLLSNYAKTPFVFNGVKYSTGESAYQMSKFVGPEDKVNEYALLVASARTADISRRLGNQKLKYGYAAKVTLLSKKRPQGDFKWIGSTVNDVVNLFKDAGVKLAPNWDQTRIKVMIDIVVAKFTTNQQSLDCLLSTASNSLLVEHSPNDNFWGDGYKINAVGPVVKESNHLGRILTALRSAITGKELSPQLLTSVGSELAKDVCSRLAANSN